jgi:hypothetical protein
MDMFTGGWIDTSNNTINQADEQMELLSHCIENIHEQSKPLPRFWYFPDTLQCLVTLTNDGEYMNESSFEAQFRDVDSLNAGMSIYILETKKVSRSWTDKWTKKGFEISGHPDDTREAANPQWDNMDKAIKDKKKEISGIYGLNMRTIVNHWFVWCGKDSDGKQEFSAQAELEAGNGLEMDVNYAHYDNNSGEGHFLGPTGTNQGNFTGSGLIMKFASAKGKVLNIYQHLNNVYDQQYTEKNDAEGFYECFRGLVDRSLQNEIYTFISIKSHNDEYYFSRSSLMRMLMYAGSKGIPVWTVQKLLDFIRMKDQASFDRINMTGNRLIFSINSSLEHSSGLTFMVPFNHGNKKIEKIKRDGSDLPFIIKQIKGRMYALASVRPGINHSIVVNYKNN